MPSKDSSAKSFLSKYVTRDKKDRSPSEVGVTSSDLSSYGINPLDESETSKKARELLNEAVNSQTQLMIDS
jgi:hypothetical protein